MNGKEKNSSPEVEQTASSIVEATPSPEHNVPQDKVKSVRRQTESGPLSSDTLLTNSDSVKVHVYYARFAIS